MWLVFVAYSSLWSEKWAKRTKILPQITISAASIAELLHGEKIAFSINHSPSLFDAPGTEDFCFGITIVKVAKKAYKPEPDNVRVL